MSYFQYAAKPLSNDDAPPQNINFMGKVKFQLNGNFRKVEDGVLLEKLRGMPDLFNEREDKPKEKKGK